MYSPENVRCGRYIIDENIVTQFSSFDCADDGVNEFINKRYLQYRKENLCVGYAIKDLDHDRMVGYYTLNTNAVKLEDPEIQKVKADGHVPAILIGYIGIDKSYHGLGWGFYSFRAMLSTIKDKIKDFVGVRALIVDALPNAISTYERWGFKPVTALTTTKQKRSCKMFLDLKKVFET
jgi:GNAT superfamily N-acetyltransferase